jgi:hypothetical protein
MELIRGLIASDSKYSRIELSRLVCEKLKWLRPDGRLKEMSCRVAMLRMERDGLITLPPPQTRNTNRRKPPKLTDASQAQFPISIAAGKLGELILQPVEERKDSMLWNELIERYHYLGYKPLPGAQIRYMVLADSRLVALLGFGAAAWKAAPRDKFIGWNARQREKNLHFVVNNARFLILPWVKSRNLASRILATATKRLPQDWTDRYGYEPLLLETFVEKDRFCGTCYRAANWIHVGQTQGRGKLDRYNLAMLPVKDIFVYPLDRKFRQKLCGRTTGRCQAGVH